LAIVVVSDIHFDLPELAAVGLRDVIDGFVLSFEHAWHGRTEH
jgi:hypothetical protein